jgi:hypothetical protein
LILGDSTLRERLDKGLDYERFWNDDLKNYLEWRRPYLLYE